MISKGESILRINKKLMVIIAVVVLTAFTVVGCNSSSNNDGSSGKDVATKGTITLLYVQWACASATTHVVADILENELGYDVELIDAKAHHK